VPLASADPRCVIVPNPTETRHTDCPGKDLTNVGWAHEHLEWANLAGANLTDAHLKDAYLDHANLSRADLTNAHLEVARLNYADLSFAVLRSRPRDITGPVLDMSGAQMIHAKLNGANVEDAVWTGTNLTHAELRGTVASAYFSQTKLVLADLTNAQFFTNWQAADMRGATLCHTFLKGRGTVDSGCPRGGAIPVMEARPLLRGPGRIAINSQINRFGIRGVDVYCKNNSYVESADGRRGRTIVDQPRVNLVSPPTITESSSPLTSLAQGRRGARLVTAIHLQFYPEAQINPVFPLRFKAVVFCTARRGDAWKLAGRT
jgi:hypothetical protein